MHAVRRCDRREVVQVYKVVWFARFLEGMDKHEARRHWREVHGPLGLKVPQINGVRPESRGRGARPCRGERRPARVRRLLELLVRRRGELRRSAANAGVGRHRSRRPECLRLGLVPGNVRRSRRADDRRRRLRAASRPSGSFASRTRSAAIRRAPGMRTSTGSRRTAAASAATSRGSVAMSRTTASRRSGRRARTRTASSCSTGTRSAGSRIAALSSSPRAHRSGSR